eukprot:157567_1
MLKMQSFIFSRRGWKGRGIMNVLYNFSNVKFRPFSTKMDEDKLMEDMDWLGQACDWGDEQVDSILKRIANLTPAKPINAQLLFKAHDFLINYQSSTDEEHHITMKHLCGLLQNVIDDNNYINKTVAHSAYLVGSMALFELEDPCLMKQAFDTMFAYKTWCTDREIQRIFHIAPFIGEWAKMMELGEMWEKNNPQIMRKIDYTSIYNCHADYISIYELCKKYELNKVAVQSINKNEWKQFNISNIRTKLTNIDFDKYEEYEIHKIMNSFARTENNEYQWIDVPDVETCVFRKIGGVCDIYSEKEASWWTNVSGPWFDNRVHAIGRQKKFKPNKDNLSPSKIPIVSNVYEIITEQYNLQKFDPKEFNQTDAVTAYKGNYGKTITQFETNTNNYLQSVVMDFECELYLGKERKWKRREDHDIILHNL